MASVYTNDLRLEEIGSGEQSGTWGDTTNTNLELIAEAFSFGEETITTNANTHPTTIANGASDPGRSIFLKYGGALDSACTITLGPETVSKLWFIHNATTDNSSDNSGPFSILIAQGDGNTKVTIPPGHVKAVYTDGAGSSAIVVDAFAALSVVDLLVDDDLTVTDDVAIGGILGVTGVLTTTAATVFNGGFTANAASTITETGNNNTLTLSSTDADANAGPNLLLFRNSGSAADSDRLATITYRGKNDAAQNVDYIVYDSFISDASDGSEDASLDIRTILAGSEASRIALNPTETVINESSNDLDFRVESNGNANALFVDGGGKSTGINVVPEVSHTSSLAIGFGGNNITSRGNADFRIMSGAFQDGASTFQYSVSSLPVAMLSMTNGGFAFESAVAGTDGNAATFTTKFYIDPDGTISTPTLGTSNVRFGVNAGDAIASDTNFNVLIGDEAGTDLNSGDSNVAVGYKAMFEKNSGSSNVAIGKNAMRDATSGDFNIAIGDGAMYDGVVTGNHNLAIGYLALENLTGGIGNIALGREALEALTVGNNNVALGNFSLEVGNSSENTAVGNYSGQNNTTTDQVFIGYSAGQHTTSGAGQTFVGHNAGKGISGGGLLTGTNNTAIGRDSGLVLQGNAFSNTFYGANSGGGVTTGDENTYIGYDAGVLMTTGSKNSILGSYDGNQNSLDIRTESNNIVLSDGDGVPYGFNRATYWKFTNSGGDLAISSTTHTFQSANNNDVLHLVNTHGSQAYGMFMKFTGYAPNDTTVYYLQFADTATTRFRVFSNGNVVNVNNSYGAISDVKLKENIVDSSSQWDDIKALRVRKYSMKADSLDAPNMLGVIAQELEAADMAGLVIESPDIDENKNDLGTVTKQVNYSILYMKAVKALQEAMTRIETLETKVAALEG